MRRKSLLLFLSLLSVVALYPAAVAGELFFSGSGDYIGIGTTNPTQPLDVSGNINATGNVTATGSISGNSASVTGNISAGSASVTGSLSAGTFSGNFSGNGSDVTNVNAATLNGQSSSDIINAAADELRTPISSLPFTVSSSGSYYLTGNLTSTGHGIVVLADNVTIDFNGFTITGPGKASGTGIGVFMQADARKNIEIKNGTVRDFGQHGVWEQNAGTGHKIINMTVRDNGSSNHSGISLAGSSHQILNCTAISNGYVGITAGVSSTLIGNKASSNGATGIHANDGSIVIGNTAYDNGEHGISVSWGSTVKNNTAYWNQWYGINLTGQSLVDGNTAFSNNRATGYGNMSACGTCTLGVNHAP